MLFICMACNASKQNDKIAGKWTLSCTRVQIQNTRVNQEVKGRDKSKKEGRRVERTAFILCKLNVVRFWGKFEYATFFYIALLLSISRSLSLVYSYAIDYIRLSERRMVGTTVRG